MSRAGAPFDLGQQSAKPVASSPGGGAEGVVLTEGTSAPGVQPILPRLTDEDLNNGFCHCPSDVAPKFSTPACGTNHNILEVLASSYME